MMDVTMPKLLVLYRFYDRQDNLLYVGITNNPRTRFNDHRTDKSWFRDVARSTMEHFDTREALEAAEFQAIVTEKPRHNIRHSVVPPQLVIAVKPRAIGVASKDANAFPRPFAIKDESKLDALEDALGKIPVLIPRVPCPECDLIVLTREYDDLIKCLNCLNMWTLEEVA